MTDITIPPAALEAGARAIAATDCPASLFDTCESHHGGCMCREQARAACLAIVEAWEGGYRGTHLGEWSIILPLPPQENSDE